MSILFEHVTAVTMDPAAPVLHDAFVLVEGTAIAQVGQTRPQHYFIPEFHPVDLHKISRIVFGIRHSTQHQYTTTLRHRFHNQHARHHRLIRKMSDKMRLVHGHILATDHHVLSYFINLIDQ